MWAKHKFYIIGAVLLTIAVSYMVCDRASLTDKINYWRGQYGEQKKVAAATEVIQLAAIAELNEGTALLQSSIDSANATIAKKEAEKEAAETELKKARQGWGALSIEAQAKLHELDAAWSAKFDILQGQYDERGKVVFSLTKQYQDEISVSAKYCNLWQSEKGLRLKAEVGLNLFDKKVANLQRQVKAWRVIAVIGVAATFLLKK